MKEERTLSLGTLYCLILYEVLLKMRSFCWGLGGVAGAIIGGSCMFDGFLPLFAMLTLPIVERPAVKWPEFFGDIPIFNTYPYLLPCGLAALVTLIGSILSLFLAPDGGPRQGAIRLLPEKIKSHPPIPEEDSTPPTPNFEEEVPSVGLARIQRRLSRRFSDYLAKRVPDAHRPSDTSALPMSAPQTRTFSRTSRANGSAYGYSGAYRSRLASNATTLNGRRTSLGSSMRRRRGSGDAAAEGSDLNFAHRLLLANENAVTNIADLWVAAAMNVDNEDPFEPDSDVEEEDEEQVAQPLIDSSPDPNAASQREARTSLAPPIPRLSRTHRPSTTSSLHPSGLGSRHASPMPHRPSVAFPPTPTTPSLRRPSTSVPAIFAHPGVKTPSAVLDAQHLLLSSDMHPSPVIGAFSPPQSADLLGTISESRPMSEADVESLAWTEKPPSLMSQLPIVVIIQYGVMALHTTTHDQIFMSYLVS